MRVIDLPTDKEMEDKDKEKEDRDKKSVDLFFLYGLHENYNCLAPHLPARSTGLDSCHGSSTPSRSTLATSAPQRCTLPAAWE